MSEGLKKLLKAVLILLGLCAVCFAGILIIAELTWFHGTLINPGGNTSVNSVTQSDPPVTPRTSYIDYIYEVPENVADRGVILMGSDFEPRYRNDYDSRYDTTDKWLWFSEYECQGNLNIEATEDEFHEFCSRFEEIGEVSFFDFGSGEACLVRIPDYRLPDTRYIYINIYRSCIFNDEIIDGCIVYDGDPCYGIPVYYDPTGKYIFEIQGPTLSDEIYLSLIEPEMVSVELYQSYSPDSLHFEDAETVESCVDVMHELRLSKVEEDRSELAMAENYTVLSFTDVNGYTNDYKIVGEYLMHGDNVYHIANPDELEKLNTLAETPGE